MSEWVWVAAGYGVTAAAVTGYLLRLARRAAWLQRRGQRRERS